MADASIRSISPPLLTSSSARGVIQKRRRITGGAVSEVVDVPRMTRYNHASSNMVTTILALPGLGPESVTIDLLHNELTISGEHINLLRPQGEGEFTCREIPTGKFRRILNVPLGMRPENFKARMKDGLLTDIPKGSTQTGTSPYTH